MVSDVGLVRNNSQLFRFRGIIH